MSLPKSSHAHGVLMEQNDRPHWLEAFYSFNKIVVKTTVITGTKTRNS
jgi:hypothetical protein